MKNIESDQRMAEENKRLKMRIIEAVKLLDAEEGTNLITAATQMKQAASNLLAEKLELERELAKWKLEWQEGEPKDEGTYWVQQTPFYCPILAIWDKGKFFFGGFSGPYLRWAGPIPEPEGGKE
jgi:hypothetical protein